MQVDANIWAFVVMALSIVIDVNRSRMLYATARKHSSQALEADALHFSTDVWSSWVVLGGLALVWLGQNIFPSYVELFTKADAVAALGVAVIVAFVTYDLGKRTVDVLLDSAPAGMLSQIAAAASGAEGVLSVGQVRVRRSGARLFVDMTVDVDRNLSFERHPPGGRGRGGAGPERCARRRRRRPHRPARERARERRRALPAPSPPTTMPPSTTSASTTPAAASWWTCTWRWTTTSPCARPTR